MNYDPASYLRLQDVVKTFPGPSGSVTVLNHINLEIEQGEYVSIIGKSGSGKSTLLNMITGIDHPTQGLVEIAGTQPHHLSESQLAVWRGREIGIVFQFFQLLPMLSLLENVLLPMDLCGNIHFNHREARAREMLALVGLSNEVDKLPGAVSGGQQQAAAIARALVNDPALIIADEPTGNLDEKTAEGVLQLFEELVGKGKTVAIVTHDPVLTARTHRTIILSDGEIIHPQIASALPWLSHPQLLQLTRLARMRTIRPNTGEFAFCEDPGLLIVSKGVLGVYKQGRRKRHQLALIREGDAISGLELEKLAPYNCFLEPLEDCQVVQIPPVEWNLWLEQSGHAPQILANSQLAKRHS
jgi:putative ABC transport system ATP-binding protein